LRHKFTGAKPTVGNLLILLGAFLYATSNNLQEILVADFPIPMVLSGFAGFGAIISMIQSLLIKEVIANFGSKKHPSS